MGPEISILKKVHKYLKLINFQNKPSPFYGESLPCISTFLVDIDIPIPPLWPFLSFKWPDWMLREGPSRRIPRALVKQARIAFSRSRVFERGSHETLISGLKQKKTKEGEKQVKRAFFSHAKMIKRHFLGILCLAAMVYFETASAISCYECNSAQDKRCLGDVNNQLSDDLKKPCPEKKDDKPYTLCRKIKQMIEFEVNGLQPDSRVIRTCGWDDSSYKNRCYQRSGFGGRQEVCACDKDGCNASTLVSASAATVALMLAFLVKLNL